MNARIGLIALVIVATLAYLIPEVVEPALSGEAVAYRAFCPSVRVNDKCPKGEEWSNREWFKPNPEMQYVVYWYDGSGVNKYSNCAVRDRRNWSCQLGKGVDGSYLQNSMSDGIYHDEYTDSPFYNVSASEWWTLKIANWLDGTQGWN